MQKTEQQETGTPNQEAFTSHVFVRVRPLGSSEQQDGTVDGLTLETTAPSESNAVALSRPKQRLQINGFRGVFGTSAKNADVFERAVSSRLSSVLTGGTLSLFCYGYTGSGKTHTVLGYDTEKGLYYLAANQLLQALNTTEEKDHSKTRQLQVSCAEIYLDRVYDLLDPQHSEVTLRVDEKGDLNMRAKTELDSETKAVTTQGLKTELITSMAALEELMQIAVARRAVGTSTTHSRSSRSHAILRVEIVDEELVAARKQFDKLASLLPAMKNAADDHQKATFNLLYDYAPATGLSKKPAPEGMDAAAWSAAWIKLENERAEELQLLTKQRDDYIAVVDAAKAVTESIVAKAQGSLGGTLLFIDLAGADNDDRDLSSAHTAQQRTESTAINKSLLALKECIRGLVARDTQIPFRNSKLTRVLEPVLRSNEKNKKGESVMVVNVGPAQKLEKNTLNTLRYGQLVAEVPAAKRGAARK